MQGSNVSYHPVLSLPRWLRIGLSCLFFVDAVLNMWKHLLLFEWVAWLSLGLYWLLYVPKQTGETLVEYLKKPRGFASLILLVAALIGFAYNLRVAYTK